MTLPVRSPDLRALAASFRAALADAASHPLQLMEVCGTHSQAIARFGVRALLPPTVRLLSGPGCPVCVTAPGEVDGLLELATRPGLTLFTFGDMMRVPGSAGGEQSPTLAQARARGADIRVMYSPLQAVEFAAAEPQRETVVVGVGFETTAPTIAASILEARRRGLRNLTVLALHKLVPPALQALLAGGAVPLQGLLLPGHVSTITGSTVYEPLARRHGVPCAIAGFEVSDVLAGILRLVEQAREGVARVENLYGRAVRPEGNTRAQQLMREVFTPAAATWRGLGTLPDSGLVLRREFGEFDAAARHQVVVRTVPEPAGCCCGAVLRGALLPEECPSFGESCTTEHPLGPCMVSSEGSCAAAWRYGVAGVAAGGTGR